MLHDHLKVKLHLKEYGDAFEIVRGTKTHTFNFLSATISFINITAGTGFASSDVLQEVVYFDPS